MFCWDSASELELRSMKQFAGSWTARERDTGSNLALARAARLWRDPQGPGIRHMRARASRRGITMTGEQSAGPMPSPGQTLVLYDGVCGLCNRLVSFLLRHDRRDQFRFAPLQSELAQTLLLRYHLDPNDFDTVVVLADFRQPAERALIRSQAALWAIGRLGGIWKLFAIAEVIPLPLREALYKFIARRRYQVFGKFNECPLPKAEDRHKFLSLS